MRRRPALFVCHFAGIRKVVSLLAALELREGGLSGSARSSAWFAGRQNQVRLTMTAELDCSCLLV